jgi:hypothetical protein
MKQSLMGDGQQAQQLQQEQKRLATLQKYSTMSDSMLQTSMTEGYLLP